MKWYAGNSLLWEWAASSQLCPLHRKMCREKENIYFSYMPGTLMSHSQRGTRDRLRCRMAWQEVRQVVLERADLAVVSAGVKGGKTRSVPVRN